VAFVIHSEGSLATSRARSMSMRSAVAILMLATVLLFAAGAAVGYGFSRMKPVAAQAAEPANPAIQVGDSPSENRLLIDRIGELTGRMAQLETEARDLAFRVGILKEMEERTAVADSARQGRLAKTQPGKPSGGPLLDPEAARGRSPVPNLGASAPADGLSDVESSMERLATLMRELDQAVVALNLAHMARPGREPVRGRPVVSSFGNRIDPFTRQRAFHSGIDYPAPIGTSIHASAGGRVIFAGYRPQYGRTVEIDHGGGLVTRYAHASVLLVKVGQVVMPDEPIARVGNTGRSTGPHLHFEILRDGRFVDPKVYLAQFRGD
jgi:murein DD-endopeptidase MepM/ murein hydrolase activator NlpD